MPYNPSFATYLDGCSVYGLYISRGGYNYTNNFQVAVNGKYLGDFMGSRPSYTWRNQYIYGAPFYDGQIICPRIDSYGAPYKCAYCSQNSEDVACPGVGHPDYNPSAFEPPYARSFMDNYSWMSLNEYCGADEAKLFMIGDAYARYTYLPFSQNTWPRSQYLGGAGEPKGARWYGTNYRAENNPFAEGMVGGGSLLHGDISTTPNTSISMDAANTVDLYAYRDWYGAKECRKYLIVDYDANDNPIYGQFPEYLQPEALHGIPGCIGIIRWKVINNELTDAVFLPLKSTTTKRFTNRLTATSYPLYQDSYLWWTEANIPVRSVPLPSWSINKTYYW